MLSRRGVMVAAVDSKSTSSNRVLVRVRSPAKKSKERLCLSFFLPAKEALRASSGHRPFTSNHHAKPNYWLCSFSKRKGRFEPVRLLSGLEVKRLNVTKERCFFCVHFFLEIVWLFTIELYPQNLREL